MKSKGSRLKLLLAAVAAGSALLLTSCAQVSYEEAQAAPHAKVVGVDWGNYEWVYVPANGSEELPMEKCEDRGFFSKKCFTTEDGLFELNYSICKRGRICAVEITFDGITKSGDCAAEEWYSHKGTLCAAYSEDES